LNKKNTVILDLPSYNITNLIPPRDPFTPLVREIIYMLWQTHHKQNILNGVGGYFSKERLELQRDIELLPEPDLFRKHQIDYIVYHKNMELPANGDEARRYYYGAKVPLYKRIAMLPGMATVYDDADLCIIQNSAAGAGSGDIQHIDRPN
jgi:hypothetical protein